MIKMHIDYKDTVRQLERLAHDKIPFALASALTKTAQAAQKRVQGYTKRAFDIKTDFIPKGIKIKPAMKVEIQRTGRTHSEVLTAPIISQWMPRHETGDDKMSDNGRKIAIPQKALLEQGAKTARGGIKTSKKPRALFERANRAKEGAKRRRKGRIPSAPFILRLKKTGDHVIFQRFAIGRGEIKPLYRFASVAEINPAWKFEDTVKLVADKAFPAYFKRELERAIKEATSK